MEGLGADWLMVQGQVKVYGPCGRQVLLAGKAEPFQRDARGRTALDVATGGRSWPAAALLRRAPKRPQGRSAQNDEGDVAAALLRHLEAVVPAAQDVAGDIQVVANSLARMVMAPRPE